MPTLLQRLGLHTPQLRAWAMYDWGNSAFFTVVVTAVYPIWFQDVAAAGLDDTVATVRFAQWTAVALIVVALISPLMGALADAGALRKRLLACSLAVGVPATALLALPAEGAWRSSLALFAVANVGVLLSLVFYDSLLPHIARRDEIDRVSTAGYALGYLGGGLLLAVCLVAILKPALFGLPGTAAATRLSFVAVAVWWLAFSLPLFLRVPEPPRRLEPDETARQPPLRIAFSRLGETFRELRGEKQAFLLLLAVLIYNDGITTIYRMATIYGREIGLPQNHLIAAVLLVQFVGIPFSFLFGQIAGVFGTKRTILAALGIYLAISVFGYALRTVAHFYVLALAVASVQGGVQALSRSLFASMIPRHKSSEMFGFYAVAERFAAVLGPAVFGFTAAAFGSSRYAVLSVMAFFLVGGALLTRVDVEEGRRAARAREAELQPA
ncbi:MAG TPA: MFS transporter [Thermoanaerobaculia bacterium]|nr:MFS transporter [Thermoanaerobaculia bacterium]